MSSFVDEQTSLLHGSHRSKYERVIRSKIAVLSVAMVLCWTMLWSLANQCTRHGTAFLSGEQTEIFEAKLPLPDYGKPVYERQLLKHVFGNSWGRPATADYWAPPAEIEFDKVVLTLHTTVDGVQYDRLAHLYIDGVAIWRTSTIEPGGKLVYSDTSKDVSLYAKLFERNNVQIMFQLDNVVNERYTGEFDITLTAAYYHTGASRRSNGLYASGRSAADRVWSLVPQTSPDKPPLVLMPSSEFKSTLPQFNANTTRAKVAIFTSGNAEEEFWYSNALQGYTDVFPQHPMLGHGPCREVSAYLDGAKIASVVPEPTIFTGGISPALWRPIVSIGTFDVRAIEVELTPLLPLLWKQESSELEIKITNCARSGSDIGQNWLTTANVVTWESDLVQSSTGDILNTSDAISFSWAVFEISKRKTMFQLVDASQRTYAGGYLNYTLTNDSVIPVLAESQTYFDFGNVQQYTHGGDRQTVSHVSDTGHSYSWRDLNSGLTLQQNITASHPLVVMLNEVADGDSIDLDVSVAKVYDISLKLDGDHSPAMSIASAQNGSSSYVISPNGNHGTGETEHKLKGKSSWPLPEKTYKRHVVAKDGIVVKDHEKLGDAISSHGYGNLDLKRDTGVPPGGEVESSFVNSPFKLKRGVFHALKGDEYY